MRQLKRNLRRSLAGLFMLTMAFACVGRAQDATAWEWVNTRGKGIRLDGLRLRAVYSRYNEKRFGSDSEHVWIGGATGYVAHTDDGGKTWKQERLGTKDQVNDIYFRDDDDGFLLAGNSIYRGDGSRWTRSHAFPLKGKATPALYGMDFSSQRDGCVVGVYGYQGGKGGVADGLIMCTRDGGESWQPRPVPLKRQLFSIDFVDENTGWVSGGGGLILRTTNGGATWSQQKSGATASLLSVKFIDAMMGWAVGERCTILYTNSGGERWAPVRSVPCAATQHPLLRSIQFWDRRGWIVGGGGTIFYTQDGGDLWKEQKSGTDAELLSLSLGGKDKKYGWAVGNDGTILRYRLK